MRALSALALLALACGSPEPTPSPAPVIEANPCATPGASYLVTYETLDGDCGDLTSSVVNVGEDGTLVDGGFRCARSEEDGCTTRNTDCRRTSNGCTGSLTSELTFSDDGATADGLMTLSVNCAASDGSTCSGTYRVGAKRQ